MRLGRIVPWVVACVTLVGLGAAIIIDALASQYRTDALLIVAWVVATGSSTAVGLVLATRRSDNPIGWLLLANGLIIAAMGLSGSYAAYAVLAQPGALPDGTWALLFSERGWPILFVA